MIHITAMSLNEDHFEEIASGAKKAVMENQPFERIEVSRKQALDMFSENKFKVEIINNLPEDKAITVYRSGPLVDLCCGPHIPNTSFIKAFSCLKASSAYWQNDKERESLQRVYGISFPDQKRLKARCLLKEVIRLDSYLPDLYYKLGLVYEQLNDKKKQMGCYMLAAQSSPNNGQVSWEAEINAGHQPRNLGIDLNEEMIYNSILDRNEKIICQKNGIKNKPLIQQLRLIMFYNNVIGTHLLSTPLTAKI